MTILGLDISHWSELAHKPVNISEQGYDFLIWKATQGSTFHDPTFPESLPDAYGKPLFAAFHYMDDSDAEKQCDNLRKLVPQYVPVIVDMEAGSLYTAQRLHASLQRAGYITPLFYLPEWYWVHIGRPDISHFPPLWASIRVKGAGYGSSLYQNVALSNWHGYGGNNPALLQFTQDGKVDGCTSPLDVSAFSGNRDQLSRLLTHSTIPDPLPEPLFPYFVKAGDTLWEIALMTYGDATRWKEIATANLLSNPNRLMPGQKLNIPGWDGVFHGMGEAQTYTVRAGDSLTAIAAKFDLSVQALYDANRIAIGRDPNLIHPGMVLLIPRIR